MKRIVRWIGAIGIVMALSACGGGGGGTPSEPTPPAQTTDQNESNDTEPTTTNHAPIATSQSITVDEDSSNNAITLAGTDSDSDTLTYTVTANPSHGSLSGTAPNLTYTPTANYNGADGFAFKVNDGTVDSATATVSITVSNTNEIPIANAGADKNITLGESVDLNGTATDIDGTVDTYEWSLNTNPSYEAFTQDITVAGLPLGTHTFTLKVTDNENGVDTDTVVVRVFTTVHHGVGYDTVTSLHTGKVWLDRNLGASQVCTAYNDPACYGDYYQWGRDTDGHEKSTSISTPTQATDIDNAGSAFIIDDGWEHNLDWAYDADSDGSLRSDNWSKTDGSSACPVGFRVPTITELNAETLDADVTDSATAFANFLKLPSAGYRRGSSGSLGFQGSYGHLWSASVDGSYSRRLGFGSGVADWGNVSRAHGLSVRCLRD